MPHDEKRFDPERAHILLDLARTGRWERERFLERFPIEPDQAALHRDFGPGFWTLPLATMVGPAGVVWALDGSRLTCNEGRPRAAAAGVARSGRTGKERSVHSRCPPHTLQPSSVAGNPLPQRPVWTTN
jgi:hypothetical protein